MKKILIFLLLPILTLFSCGRKSIYGIYSFQMGRDKGTHVGFQIALKQDDYIETTTGLKRGKQFQVRLNISDDVMPPEPLPDDPNYFQMLFVWLFANILRTDGINGYYGISEAEYPNDGKRIIAGLEMLPGVHLDSQEIGKIIVAYLKNDTIKFIVPVSIVDLQCQLCWYGIYIYYKGPENEPHLEYTLLQDLPPVQRDDRVGTHPTASDVDYMNTRYADLFRPKKKEGEYYNPFTFRDYNCINIMLKKG